MVHDVTPTYGVGTIPFPEAAAQVAAVGVEPVAVVVIVTFAALRMFGDARFPPEAWTTSLISVIVSVSEASSRTFEIVNEHVYGEPTVVGLVQPFVKPMP
jgi:hypothetical protein